MFRYSFPGQHTLFKYIVQQIRSSLDTCTPMIFWQQGWPEVLLFPLVSDFWWEDQFLPERQTVTTDREQLILQKGKGTG